MIRGERGRNEDDTCIYIYIMYEPEVFIQRSAVKVHLYGTWLVYVTYLISLILLTCGCQSPLKMLRSFTCSLVFLTSPSAAPFRN